MSTVCKGSSTATVLVHTYNRSYLEGGGRSIPSLRPALATLLGPYLKNKIPTKELGV
jgi:hypothetical protein